MGLIISRFKKKKTTLEILEKLEKDITSIEQYRMNTEQRRRRIVAQLIVYSVGAYVLAAAIFYFYWFPSTLKEQVISATPLLLFPFVVILIKKILSYHYSRKITQNEQKLCDLREEKKRILEDVMDKETYKVARTILEKFAPEQLRSKGMDLARSNDKMSPGTVKIVPPTRPTPLTPSGTPLRQGYQSGFATTELRRRTLPSAMGHPPGLVGQPSSFSAESLSPYRGSQQNSGTSMPSPRPSINGQGFSSEYRPPGPPLPRPVLPRERSYLDRVVEYLVGDGPSNRFALICKACESHNGMALKEEFEYLPFRCCYCHFWNPARKQRPQAPRLSPTSGIGPRFSSAGKESVDDDTSDSEKYSNSDSSSEDSGPELESLNKSSNERGSTSTDHIPTNMKEDENSADKEVKEFLRSLDEGTSENAVDAEIEKPPITETESKH